jgi:hypothetical protein
MAGSGLEMLLRAAGVDPNEIRANVEAFMMQTRQAVQQINANQREIVQKLDLILATMPEAGSTAEYAKPDGSPTGVLETTEKFPAAVLQDAGMIGG